MQSLIVDFLLVGGTIVTMDSERRIIQNGIVAVKNSKIVWIGALDQVGTRFDPAQTLDVSEKVIIPGMVNAHGHWAMTLFRGLIDDCSLESWLEKIWKVEAVIISAKSVVAGSELAMIEMIRSGTTCAADMYWQYDETFEAVRRAGFRMVNGPSFANIPGFENRKDVNYNAAVEFLDRYHGDPLIHLRMQAHSTYTTNQKMLEDIVRIAEERNIGFITHASESKGELELVRKKYGKTPIEVLDSVGLLGEKTLLAHCVHLSDVEIERLAETHTSVAHCPSSNLKLSSGIARVAEMVRAGVNVSIGTDGAASNNDLDLFHEAQLAALVQKGITGDPTVLPGEKVFSMLTIDGARAVGLADRVGSIEVGKLADLVVVDFDSANLTPCYDLYSHFIYAISASNVCHVMINGKMIMQNRQMLTLDEEKVKSQVRGIAQQIRLI
ncbi:MAG: N-ethylammeline chlorohydrolase [Chloroflexi bacterium HGW-Chloroflexi-3]|nr:MAG: N-ethylammeline chlorohydrolase [Chloroflexi bacterium HGW-Chloroflexi-3]